MKVFGSSLSPYVRKVLVVAAELDLEVDAVPIPPGSTDPEFRECSPFGKIPGFRDGEVRLSDSSAIAAYLDACHPQGGLIPAEPEQRARTIWFDEFADTILGDAVVAMFGNRIVAPRFLKREGDLALADRAERDLLPPALDYLDGAAAGGSFLVGDRLTLADIAVASQLANLQHLDIVIDRRRHPHAAAFAERMHARPAFSALMEKERAFLARHA